MKFVRMLWVVAAVLLVVMLSSGMCKAATMGTVFTYQGRLMDNNDVADGLYDFQFSLWRDPCEIGGMYQVGLNVLDNVEVVDGYFTTELDFSGSVGVFNGEDRWVEVAIRPGELEDPNAYTTLTPRHKLTPTPYAFYAASVGFPLELSASDIAPIISGTNSGSGDGVYGESNNSHGVYGRNQNSGNYGYLGSNSYGMYGKHNISGNYGYLGSSSYGVYGRGNLRGVYGEHDSSGNYGYLGSSECGVKGSSVSDYGIYGYTSTGSGDGVYGKHGSSGNYGCLGTEAVGVFGKHASSDNYGELGSASSGVFGSSHSDGDGVSGYSWGSGNGVYGYSSSGYAGYFDGNVYAVYNVSAESFTDRTPYPKDLATAYDAVMSMAPMPDRQYDENNKGNQLDHSKLSSFIRSKDGNRDLSATVSCLNEVLKDLIRKNHELEKTHANIEQLQKQNQILEAKLVKLEAMITDISVSVSQKGEMK